MLELTGKNMVVIGGSRGIGRCIAESGAQHGARVLAVARHEAALRDLARNVPSIEVLAIDASRSGSPPKVFGAVLPDILVLSGGAIPADARLHLQSWREFAVNWESHVRIAFYFCKAALSRPLPAGSLIVLIASSAALAGSPLTGGYAGSKRTQMLDCELQPERIGPPWSRAAIRHASSRDHSGFRLWKACSRRILQIPRDVCK